MNRTESSSRNCGYFPIILIVGIIFAFLISFDTAVYALSDIDRPIAEWELVAVTGYEDTWFRDVEFVNSTHGWLAGDGILLRSTNGGRSWHSQLETRWFFWCISIVSSSDLLTITN